ncbi:Gfo/Idh/MocA family oxidoreductase [Ruminococcaceae bacterium OttesenSCG-928-L11]|nr:Gfo/Idh/MocA family oxidoreductase [Ruminococcaceae bacterium OttesenSCG-928-L11]
MKKVKVGVVGCGGICKATYMKNMVEMFEIIDVVGAADLIESRAQWMADKYGIKKMTVDEIINDPEIEIVVNLTYPESHYEITKAAMEHGKHVYCEKMMAPTFAEATELMQLMKEKNVMYTTAPDTFLGAWEQSARKYLDDGIIGKPVTVHAQVTSRYQPESPFFDTEPKHFFFPLHYGGGFPFDLGGYYLHEMINLFGSVKRVTGFGGNINPNRVYTNPKHPKYKETFEVNTPTTLLAALEFENGVLGTFHISSDSYMSQNFTVTGTDGTMKLGDPNMFNDRISVLRPGAAPSMERLFPGMQPDAGKANMANGDNDVQQLAEFTMPQSVELPLLHGFYESSRGVGLADMCYALRNNRRPRCHADIGYHSIEIIHAIEESCKTGQIYNMTTTCERPKPIAPSALSVTGQEATLDD